MLEKTCASCNFLTGTAFTFSGAIEEGSGKCGLIHLSHLTMIYHHISHFTHFCRHISCFLSLFLRRLLSNGSLYLPHVTAEEQGNYQCVVTVENKGSMASKVARVQAAGLPSLENQPQDLRVFPGQTAHFSCRMNGPLKYSVAWLKDERPLVLDASRMFIMPSGTSLSYKVLVKMTHGDAVFVFVTSVIYFCLHLRFATIVHFCF